MWSSATTFYSGDFHKETTQTYFLIHRFPSLFIYLNRRSVAVSFWTHLVRRQGITHIETCPGMPSTAFLSSPQSLNIGGILMNEYIISLSFSLHLNSRCCCCKLFLFFFKTGASSSQLEVRGCSLPPEIANGRYQILPMRRSFSSSSFSPLSSRIQHWNNMQMNGSLTATTSPVVVPVYSSALYSCYRGFLSGGSSLISCSPGGWWQPTHNAPRCLPFGSSSSSGGIHHNHGITHFFRFFFLL